jgi:hypothetical protein
MTTGASVRVSVRGLKELREQLARIEQLVKGGKLGQTGSGSLDYVRYVQDEEYQAGIHRGRWQTLQQVVEEDHDRIVAFFELFLAE